MRGVWAGRTTPSSWVSKGRTKTGSNSSQIYKKNWDINQQNATQNPFADNPPSIKKCLSEHFLCAQYQVGIIKKSMATSISALKKLRFLHEKTKVTHRTVRKLYKTVSSKALKVFNLATVTTVGSPAGSEGKESAHNAGNRGSIPGLGRSPWRREWLPTLVFFPGNFHRQRSLEGYIQSMGSQRVWHDWVTNTHTQ